MPSLRWKSLFAIVETMKVIFVKLFESYFDVSVPSAMRRLGWEVTEETFYTPKDFVHDSALQQLVHDRLEGSEADFVFTVNFWPLLSPVFKDLGLRYVSWSYDAPLRLTGTDEMENDNNLIFLFDRGQVRDYRRQGITRVFHLPLGVDPPVFEKALRQKRKATYGVSFIGQFYASPYMPILSAMDDYLKGLLQGICDAQRNLIGYYILPELITDEIADKVNERLIYIKEHPDDFPIDCSETGAEFAGRISRQNLIYTIATRITCIDRLTLVSSASRVTPTLVCTDDTDSLKKLIPHAEIHGRVDYYTQMPVIFRDSVISLCPSLRCISTGIPLRALDIMASHGLVMLPATEEAYEYFENGADSIIYSSYEEAFDLMKFYLRKQADTIPMKERAYKKAKSEFSMEHRLKQIEEKLDD